MRQHGWLINVSRFVMSGFIDMCGDAEQLSCPGDVGGVIAVGKEAIVPDAVQAFW